MIDCTAGRCLLLGPPADPKMAEALHEAAAAVAAEAYRDAALAAAWGARRQGMGGEGQGLRFPGSLSPDGPLAELWRAVAGGAGALSEAELVAGAGELLRLGEAPPGALSAADVAARLRWVPHCC